MERLGRSAECLPGTASVRGDASLFQIREGDLQSADPSWSLLPSGPALAPHQDGQAGLAQAWGEEGLASAPRISALSCGGPLRDL